MKKIQLTDIHKEKLFQIPLFRDLPLNIKESLLEKLDFIVYAADKKEIVVTQGTPCNKLYVLLEGKLRTDIIDGLGNEVMIEYIIAPRTFATPHLFSSHNTLPATFTSGRTAGNGSAAGRTYPVCQHQPSQRRISYRFTLSGSGAGR